MFRDFLAEALAGCNQTQVLQLRRMQTMRDCLDLGANFRETLPEFVKAILKFNARVWRLLLEYIEVNRQHRDTLIDVVMKLSRNPCTFLLLRINQPATDAREGFLGLLAIGNVDARPDIPCKRIIRVKSRDTSIQHPSIVTVVPAHPILHRERLTAIERVRVDIKTWLHIFSVDALQPAVSQFCSNAPTGKVQPRLIDVGAQLVGA